MNKGFRLGSYRLFEVGQLLASLDPRDFKRDGTVRIVKVISHQPTNSYLVKNVRTHRLSTLSMTRVAETLGTTQGWMAV